MLELQRSLPGNGGQLTYNEVVVDFDAWAKWHPHSVDAVWYMKIWNCGDTGSAMMCEHYARQVHGNFLRAFGLSSEQLPLLEFDPENWKAPFSLAKEK